MALIDTKKEKQKQEEEKLKEMQEQHTAQPAEEVDPVDGLTPEDESWKKRYGDLRTVVHQLKDEIKTLKSAPKEEAKVEPPATRKDIEEWKSKYPDAYKIVETLADEIAEKKLQPHKAQFEELQKDQAKSKREKEAGLITAKHPDFDDIKASDDFHDWVEEQPKTFQDAVYSPKSDATTIIRILDLYKTDLEKTPKAKSEKAKAAAEALVSTKGRTDVTTDKKGKSFSESEVAEMSSIEYEKNEEAILKSQREGTFVYDLSVA